MNFELSTIDHIGAPAWNVATATSFFKRVGVLVVHEETIESFNIHAVFPDFDGVLLEFLEPTGEGRVKTFLEQHGPGFRHIAYRVPDIESAIIELGAVGIRFRTDEPVTSVGGSRVIFVEEADSAGFGTELVERREPVGSC